MFSVEQPDQPQHRIEKIRPSAGFLDAAGHPVIDPENNMKTLEQGAATSVWCATHSLLDGKGGVYCENCNIAHAVPANSEAPLGVRPWAMAPDLAERLWQVSEKLTGVAFPGRGWSAARSTGGRGGRFVFRLRTDIFRDLLAQLRPLGQAATKGRDEGFVALSGLCPSSLRGRFRQCGCR